MSTRPSHNAMDPPAMTPEASAALSRAGFSRRSFLKGSGVLVVGFSMAGLASRLGIVTAADAQEPEDSRNLLDSWIAIAADGAVTAYTGKCELGQGLYTAQLQLIAEELTVPVDRITLIQCDTAITPDQGTTSGAQSHPTNFNLSTGGRSAGTVVANLALAAATAREALLELAANRLGTPVGQLTIADGVISARSDPARHVTYGELVGGRKFEIPLNTNARRKPRHEWTVLGRSVPRVDLPDLATGRAEFVQNVRLPAMLHGAVVRPPAVGATLVSVDESSVQGMPGLVKVVVRNNFVGVVAEKSWQALQAAERLRVIWTEGTILPSQRSYYQHMRTQPTFDTLVVDSGDVDAKLAGAATVLRASYYHPYQAHGSVGTSCAVADVQPRQTTVWAASQNVHALRSTTAMILDVPLENVRVIFTRGAGCYGINGADTVAFDAALLSQAAGRPVRVQLTRKDEMAWENFGMPFVIDQQAGLDAAGNIVAWDCETWSAGRGGRPGSNTPGNVVTGFLAGFEPAPFVARHPSPPPAAFIAVRHVAPSYVTGCVGGSCEGTGTVASERALARRVLSPFFTGPLRTPERLQNTFAHECFMDELAAYAKADPVEYRLRHLRDPRLIDVVKAAAKAANWTPRPSPQAANARTGTVAGRGFASVACEGHNGWVALAADVEVHQDTGAVVVKRLFIGHDCGPMSNPDGVRNQVEGGALHGMSRALVEEVTWDDRKVTAVDWRTYASLSLGIEVPVIEIALIDRPDEEAAGAGETSITVMAPAISNAIFDATGVRIREVPFTPERVRAAIAAHRAG